MSKLFPCTGCGLCCRNLKNNVFAHDLDRGDGICYYLNENMNLCTIYEDRPLTCRVEDFYNTFLTDQYSWDSFVKLNLEICEKLQKNINNKY